MKTTFYIKRFYTDFVGHVDHVDYVGPYMDNQQFALEAQYRTDSLQLVTKPVPSMPIDKLS
mgnify:CR=1 FL=1